MSKHCEVCNRSYADDLDACPHCAEVVEISEADVVDLGAAPESVEEGSDVVAQAEPVPDSDVDLGLPVASIDPNWSGPGQGSEGSGISVVEWASLVEEEPAPAEPAAASFDDPDDADLIGHAAAPEANVEAPPAVPPTAPASEATLLLPPAGAGEGEDALAADLDAVRSIFAGDASASFARRGPEQPSVQPLAQPPAAEDDDSALDLLAPIGAEEVPVVEPADSGVNLGADPRAPKSPSSQALEPEMLEVVDSGIDLASAELEEQVVAEAIGTPPAAAPEGGVDLAAPLPEEESGSILYPAEDASSDSGIDLSGVEVVEPADALFVDSSAVLPGAEVVDVAPSATPAEELVVRPISDSGIDLGGVESSGPDSSPQAGIEQNTPGTSDSGVDRIAAEVESGMNLGSEAFDFANDPKSGSGSDQVDEIIVGESATALTAGELPSSEEEVDLTEMPASDAVDSSAVDLGASATFPVAAPEPSSGAVDVNTTRPYEGKAKSIHGEEEEVAPSEVDLGSRHDGDSAMDFFEPSEGLAGAPTPTEEDEESAGLPAVDEESAVEVEEELEPAAEEEAAVVEEEEGAVVEEEAPTALEPKRKEKRRSTAGAWIGGVLLGGVVTAGVLLGLWLFNIEPPKEWRSFIPGASPTPAAQNGPVAQGPAPAAPPLTLADRTDLVKSGDLDRAAKAGIETADESKPDEVAARGEFRVRKYLMDHGPKAPIKADDPDMKKAMDDLEKAKDKSDDALFWLGVAKEAANQKDEALKLYQEGWDRTKQPRFQDGVNRVSAQTGPTPADMSRAAPALDPALFALIVTGLAPEPAAAPPAEQPATDEAGSAFWEATKLAREGKYDDAVKALDEAVKRHTERRFTILGKAQNPNSDPTEEIFLRSCQELKAYYALRQALQTSKLPVVKGVDPVADVAALVAEDKKRVGDLEQAVLDAKTAKDQLKTATDALTDANAKLKTTNDALTDAQQKLTDANKDLVATKESLTASEKKADALATDLKAANETLAKKTETLKGVADALTAAKALNPGEDEAAVVPAVKEILQLKDVQATEATIRNLKDQAEKTIGALKEESEKTVRALKEERDAAKVERDGLRTALKERRRPEQMLSIWLPLLRERDRKDLAEQAILDAERVLQDDKAAAQDKAHAHAVKGIALRDEEKYAEAKAELGQAQADLPRDDGEWLLETNVALTEASDPSAYYAAKAEEYRQEGRNIQALGVLDRALESAAPAARAGLLAERGALRLDKALARANGQVGENDADLVAARKDADEAKKDGAAEGFYLGGRIDEALGRLDAAAADYGQALDAHKDLDADGARYRAALARILVQQSPDMLGQPDAAARKAQTLATQVLSAKGADVPFEARAEALAVQGLWTEALNAYVEGIRPHISQERAAVLLAIVQGHPALRRPTLRTVADPAAAAKHYAAGLQWYNDQEYDKAQKEFFTAVEHDGQDARYFYYLGLSRLMQGDRDAFEDFEQGARLEQQNRPGRAAVSAALERVQGAPRERLNAIRDRPR